ncbi:MAG: DUF21 domain-containing protein [Planctomycetota bacterium]
MDLLLLLLPALGASAAFAGAEIGLYSFNPLALRPLARTSRRAAFLERSLRRPAGLLCTLLVGNNLANFLVSHSGVRLLAEGGVERTGLFATLFLTPLVFVLAEVGPKQWVLRDPLHRTLLLAPLLSFFRVVFAPLTHPLVASLKWLAPRDERALARHQLAALLYRSPRSGLERDRVLVAAWRALQARGRGLRPFLTEVPFLPRDCGREQALATLAASPSRLALIERTGRFPGLLRAPTLVASHGGDRPVRLAEDLPWFPSDLDLAQALGRLRALGVSRALLGRPGAWEGICDLEGILARLLAPETSNP